MLPVGRYDLVVPDGAGLGVLVLHPHPDHGGDRTNVVVDACFRAAIGAGFAAIRPDVSSTDGEVVAGEALALLPTEAPLAVIGYSFGAGVAARLVDPRIAGWVLVAPPMPMLLGPDAPIGTDPRSKLVLAPAHDQFCPPEEAARHVAGWAATTVEEVTGADHFVHGAAAAVAARAVAWLAALA